MTQEVKTGWTTPPWIVEIGEEFSGDNWLVASLGSAEVDGKLLQVFVTTDHIHASEMEGDAVGDAHLIAAAPALYAALEALMDEVRMGGLVVRYEGSDGAITSSRLHLAHAALKQARGEA